VERRFTSDFISELLGHWPKGWLY